MMMMTMTMTMMTTMTTMTLTTSTMTTIMIIPIYHRSTFIGTVQKSRPSSVNPNPAVASRVRLAHVEARQHYFSEQLQLLQAAAADAAAEQRVQQHLVETSKRLEVMEVTGMGDAGAVLFFWDLWSFRVVFVGVPQWPGNFGWVGSELTQQRKEILRILVSNHPFVVTQWVTSFTRWVDLPVGVRLWVFYLAGEWERLEASFGGAGLARAGVQHAAVPTGDQRGNGKSLAGQGYFPVFNTTMIIHSYYCE